MYNNELEKIDNQEKAYLLGLMYADGWVGNTRYSSGLVLHKQDEELVNKIHLLFPFFRKRKDKSAYRLSRSVKKLHTDLISNGLLPRKSYENKDFLRFPEIEKSLYPHFIRGFYDGDGSIQRRKVNNLCLEISGVCFFFMTDILKVLYDNNINFNINLLPIRSSNVRKQNCYKIYSTSYRETKKFCEYIYKDANIYMKRKYDVFTETPEYKNKKERLQCPKCNSFSTVFNGIRNNKTRIRCNNCLKHSSITAPVNSNINSGEGELLED